jgi:hypothetical protein
MVDANGDMVANGSDDIEGGGVQVLAFIHQDEIIFLHPKKFSLYLRQHPPPDARKIYFPPISGDWSSYMSFIKIPAPGVEGSDAVFRQV